MNIGLTTDVRVQSPANLELREENELLWMYGQLRLSAACRLSWNDELAVRTLSLLIRNRTPDDLCFGLYQSWGSQTNVLCQDRSQTGLGLGLCLNILVLLPSLAHTPLLERRVRRQNFVLADRRASDGGVVGGSAAAADVTYDDESSHPDVAVTSSENLANGGRRHSTEDTVFLLSAILTQLRYITADMWRHCKSTQVKDEWKLVAKVIDRLLMLIFIVVITALTVGILCLYPTLSTSDVHAAFSQ